MQPVVIVHYHEIALKGDNRVLFERQLMVNLERACASIAGARAFRMHGRVRMECADARDGARMLERTTRVFGVANAWLGYRAPFDPVALQSEALRMVRERITAHRPATCAVRVHRADKTFSTHSSDLERSLGGTIHDATGIAVDLEQPELLMRIEIVDGSAFVLFDRIPGPGGLPVGVSGKVVALLSSGFDSPVAAWRMLRRGCTAVFVHFHSYPYTSDASLRNVRAIVERLAIWQGPSVLVTIPLIAYQKAVMVSAPHAYRVLLYRRAMVRIAGYIAHVEGAHALVTGENLGQVASQTMANMAAVAQATEFPIFRPLIGYDKIEIIAEAERLGTATIARQPYDDCCSLFTPVHPATSATAATLARMEASGAWEAEYAATLAGMEREVIHASLRGDDVVR